MTQYHLDERDLFFNMKECPGLEPLNGLDAFPDCDEDTLDMIYEQSISFARKVLAPLHDTTDKIGCKFEAGRVMIPDGIREAWDQYRELGVIGMMAPEEFGGSHMPHFFAVPTVESECGSFVSFSMLPLLTRGSANLIASFGSQELKETYLEKMYSGEWTGTMCLTEPQAGSDVGASSSKAVPEGDHYKITGTKIFITWGEHDLAENIIHLVLARIEGAPAGSKGLSLFVVPRNHVDADGNVGARNDVACGNIEHKMGIHACPTCVINFGTEGNCIGYLVGEPNQGMRCMFQMMNEARYEVGMQGLGQASAAYLAAVNYASERTQGSIKTTDGVHSAKIIEHPDVRRMLLHMRALVEGTRSMLYHVALYMDLAKYHPSEAERYQALVELLTPICKSYGSDQGFRVSELAIQTFGGYGYCQEYKVEQYMRDLKIASIYEGTNGIQTQDLLFRKILMNQGAYLKIWLADVHQLCGELAGSDLAPQAETLKNATDELVKTVTALGVRLQGGGASSIQFCATDFQANMGHIVVAYYLLTQAKTAQQALAGDPSDNDRKFYGQKLVTTRYFFAHFIPQALSGLSSLETAAAPGLEADFS